MYHKGQEIWLVEYPVMKGVIVSDPPEHIAGYGFVDVSVQVYDESDLVWRFDLVVVEVIDANTVKVSLASGTAAQIRYVIHGY